MAAALRSAVSCGPGATPPRCSFDRKRRRIQRGHGPWRPAATTISQKPFSLAVLRARWRQRCAAARQRGDPGIRAGAFPVRFFALHFEAAGREITLSATEQRLLRILVANRGRTLPRESAAGAGMERRRVCG